MRHLPGPPSTPAPYSGLSIAKSLSRRLSLTVWGNCSWNCFLYKMENILCVCQRSSSLPGPEHKSWRCWGGEMAGRVKVLAPIHDYASSIPRVHKVEGEN